MKLVKIAKILTVLTALTTLGLASPAFANTQASPDDFTGYGINPQALKMAFDAYKWAIAKGQVRNKSILTVVDMTKPNSEKRLYVLDLNKKQVVMMLPVANGKNSGTYRATRFSNRPGSLESSLGAYVTADTYYGHHGRSLRVIGLERGINDNAYSRSIVVHSAYYATDDFIRTNGRVGGSWGCFAVSPTKSEALINVIKGGSVIFSYAAPEDNDPYLTSSYA